jgi:hypothetical protein
VRVSGREEHGWLSWLVLPVMEAARMCISRRYPAWIAKTVPPSTNGEPQCGILVNTGSLASQLHICARQKQGQPVEFVYQMTRDAIAFPARPLENTPDNGGKCLAFSVVHGLVDEFLYSLVAPR